jgi:hypothetical protein
MGGEVRGDVGLSLKNQYRTNNEDMMSKGELICM